MLFHASYPPEKEKFFLAGRKHSDEEVLTLREYFKFYMFLATPECNGDHMMEKNLQIRAYIGSSCHGSAVTNQTTIHEDVGLFPRLAQ